MRDGDAVTKTRTIPVFTCNKALEDILHFQTRHFAADQGGNLFECALFMPPGAFTKERPGVRIFSSRIMGRGY